MAPGTVIDLFNNLRHQPVVPAQALGLDKGPKFRRVLTLIGPVKQVFQHPIPNFPALVFVGYPKIRRNVQPIGVFPENVRAKAVNRGDFRQV